MAGKDNVSYYIFFENIYIYNGSLLIKFQLNNTNHIRKLKKKEENINGKNL